MLVSGLLFSVILFLFQGSIIAQPTPSDTSRFGELKFPAESSHFPTSGIRSPLLQQPSNLTRDIEYDPETGRYVFTEKVGRIELRQPSSMSLDEYRKYDMDRAKRDYWYQKAREESVAGPSFMKNLRLGNEAVDKVFGTDVINITPKGSAQMIFGYNISTNENTYLSERNRRQGSFLFESKIQMNVTGSIGDKMEVGLNYNTEAAFAFENKTKLQYTGKEDEIIKKIEAGDVSLTLPGSLITGSQSLFGLKTELQFGKLTVTSVISHQQGESQTINVEGGAQISEFEIDAVDYDENRHFFLSHFFRENYNSWLSNLPAIESQVRIQQIEVWVVNKQTDYTNVRNIAAFMDLGEGNNEEGDPNYLAGEDIIGPVNTRNSPPTSNDNNALYGTLTSGNYINSLRRKETVESAILSFSKNTFKSGRDYYYLESARPLSEREYTLNEQLGFISLNSPLRNGEILAVAFTYSYRGKIYKVGEISSEVSSPEGAVLVVKLLRGTTSSPKYPNWDLMMKNVYAIGAYQVKSDKFVLNVLYRNDKTGVPVNYISEVNENHISPDVQKQPLLKVLELDNLDTRNEPNPDGFFDYVEGLTINSRNGRIYFPLLEPFGSDLRRKITDSVQASSEASRIADKYVFEELYDSTRTRAEQVAEKSKFFLKGQYQASSGSDIQLNAMNIPRGSVIVSAGGQTLIENQDYTVDYTLGRVKIINQGLVESGTPIKISLESNSMFNLQTKTLLGTHLDYRFSENFNIGATIMNLTETPYTKKVNMGDEPISNTIWGLNTSYRTQSQFLTTLVDKIPFIETKQPSSIVFEGEFAHLIPGSSKAIEEEEGKEPVAYIDDFEAAQTKIELKTYYNWYLSSPPINNPDFYNSSAEGLAIGYGRAKIAWYTIDPLFYDDRGGLNPNTEGIKEDLGSHYARRIKEDEIFPEKENPYPGENHISIFNIAYYPEERGPYNYDPGITNDLKLTNPERRWGGLMREIVNSDFETSNIEFIEFWMMDPFGENENHSGGDFYIQLGEVSEDILPDNRKSFEGGLPYSEDDTVSTATSIWARYPTQQAYTNTFALDEGREMQDVGLDGLSDENEIAHFSDFLESVSVTDEALEILKNDVSADNYKYYLAEDYSEQDGIIKRYKNYNNMEGNSPFESGNQDYTSSSVSDPDMEDINRDNTVNSSSSESYFQYKVSLRPEDLENVGRNFIVDMIEVEVEDMDPVTWYQVRIPLALWDGKVGDIDDFKSIRFMRLMLAGFSEPVILRFASLNLVRGEWRRYNFDIGETGPDVTIQPGMGDFEVSAVNIEENSQRVPINYVLPPGIDRVTDPGNPQIAHQNEQALSLKIIDLEDGDARAVFKNVELDLRQYKKLKMFLHAEALPGYTALDDYEISAFIRIGSDYKNNYYEYEIPLKVTVAANGGILSQREVWKNDIVIDLDQFVELKKERNRLAESDPNNYSVQSVYIKQDRIEERVSSCIIKVKGNPNLANIRQIMVGIRNPGDINSFERNNDGLPKSGEVWFNELRLTDFNNRGGWAANGRIQAQLADFGIVNVAGSRTTPGFGGIEEKVLERAMEETDQYDLSSNLELGKFFPEKASVSIPLYFGTSKTIITPEYFPRDPDITFKEILKEAENKAEKDSLKHISQDVISRTSINITNMRWNKRLKKLNLLSPANLTLNAGYTQTLAHNYTTEYNNLWRYNAGLNYVFSTRPKTIEPFRKTKSKLLKKPALKLVKDVNFNPYPSRFTFGTVLDRNYQEMKMRNVYEDIELLIEPTVNKDFVWTRNYEMKWDLTRSLKFDYSATADSRIDELRGQQDLFISNNDLWRESVWESMSEGGRIMNFLQKMDATYTIPINKIPIFNWVSANASYGTTYNWIKGDVVPGKDLGNTIKNSNTFKINSTLSLKSFYSKVGYFKRLDTKYAKKTTSRSAKKTEDIKYKEVRFEKRTFFRKDEPKNIIHKLKTENVTIQVIDAAGNEVTVNTSIENENKVVITAPDDLTGVTVVIIGKIPKGVNPFIFIADHTMMLITGFKSFNIGWTQSTGSILPGFKPEPDYFGLSTKDFNGAPGYPFILGIQDTGIVRDFIDRDWLTEESTFSRPFEFNRTTQLDLRTSFEPFKGFRIDFTANRSYSEFNEQLFFSDNTLANYNGYFVDHIYTGGSFSISVITLATAFENPKQKNIYSHSYDRFLNNRPIISARLYRRKSNEAGENYTLYNGRSDKYFDGFGPTSQDVLVPAFLAAYTGIDPNNISLSTFFWGMMPNWKVTIDKLTDLDFIKKYFKSFTINHTYKSTFSLTGFATNVNFFDTRTNNYFSGGDEVRQMLRDAQYDYISRFLYSSASIKEDLRPLIGIDMSWNNNLLTKFEISRSRLILLTMSNNQVNETRNRDYTIGAGYRFKEVPLNITAGGTKKQIKSDLNVRFDVTLRDNMTIIRQIDIVENDGVLGTQQITTGANATTYSFTADYVFSKNLSVQLFFDRKVNVPHTSDIYRTAETNFGLSLRLAL